MGGLPVLPNKLLSIFEFYICRLLSNHGCLAQQTMNCSQQGKKTASSKTAHIHMSSSPDDHSFGLNLPIHILVYRCRGFYILSSLAHKLNISIYNDSLCKKRCYYSNTDLTLKKQRFSLTEKKVTPEK